MANTVVDYSRKQVLKVTHIELIGGFSLYVSGTSQRGSIFKGNPIKIVSMRTDEEVELRISGKNKKGETVTYRETRSKKKIPVVGKKILAPTIKEISTIGGDDFYSTLMIDC